MEKEYEALLKKYTWESVLLLPKGKKTIGFKRVYKVKLLAVFSLLTSISQGLLPKGLISSME